MIRTYSSEFACSRSLNLTLIKYCLVDTEKIVFMRGRVDGRAVYYLNN